MKNLEPFNIESSCDVTELITIALSIVGKVHITEKTPIMKIKIKGNLILDFSGETNNQTLELYLDE